MEVGPWDQSPPLKLEINSPMAGLLFHGRGRLDAGLLTIMPRPGREGVVPLTKVRTEGVERT